MNKPVMMGEQTNVPKNEEELAAALAKKAEADAAEQQAHEAARAGSKVSQQARIMATENGLFSALWDLAEATGTVNHHINAVLFTTAVIIANAKSHGEQVKIIEYLSNTAAELKQKASKPNPQEPSNGN